MITTVIGIFLIFHAMVHLLYAAHCQRKIELRPSLVWPDGSWAFSKLLGDENTRKMASYALAAAALGFAIGGAGILLGQAWQTPVVVGACILSTVIYLTLWDGKFQALPEKGGFGILINLAILIFICLR